MLRAALPVASGNRLTECIGGLNFLSRKYGFSCDNVYGYEVVLGDGRVVYATATQNSDLWLALKGGSFNFGIITRFDLAAFQFGQMWGGLVVHEYTPDLVDAEVKAFQNFMDPANFDDLAVALSLFSWTNVNSTTLQGTFGLSNGLFYAAPVADPPVYNEFLALPSVSSTVAIDNMGAIVETFGQLSSATSYRCVFASLDPPEEGSMLTQLLLLSDFEVTYTFKNADAATYQQIIASWENATTRMQNITGVQQLLLLQPLPVTNGTNVLGVPAERSDFVLATIATMYEAADDDAAVKAVVTETLEEHVSILREKGLYIGYLYLNYADISQDPFASYGRHNMAKLEAAARTYDPLGIFQTGAPVGFKLFRGSRQES